PLSHLLKGSHGPAPLRWICPQGKHCSARQAEGEPEKPNTGSTVGRGAWMAQEWGRLLPTPGAQCPVIAARWLYEGVSREKAEELLLLPCNRSGSFLIRESQTRQGCYSLSVRRTNHSSWDSIKHYRINRLENGWLYIAPRLTFPSLQELVDYYSEIGDELCCLLKEPCFIQGAVRVPAQNLAPPVVIKKSALNWQELDSSALFSEAPPPEGESPVSLGLREAISSYLFLTEELPPEKGEKGSLWKSA
uniref:Src like adaptor 2 n=1 Tax=Terrapene triunguis TaxID=2587831 RepID=A0A674JWE6_9SAUR